VLNATTARLRTHFWQSREQFDRFAEQRIGPAVGSLGGDAPQPDIREFPVHEYFPRWAEVTSSRSPSSSIAAGERWRVVPRSVRAGARERAMDLFAKLCFEETTGQRVALEQLDDAPRRLTDPQGFGRVALRIS
jgi:hypothetical protein